MEPISVSAEASRHKCLIYDGHPSEQLAVVVPLLEHGLRDNWRCLYLGSPEDLRMVSEALGGIGVDTAREASRGALVLSSARNHLEGGRFEPTAMIDGLCEAIDAAVKDGFEGLCATGDMRWELGADSNFDRLLEYEARLETVFRDRPLRGICQYHRAMVPEDAVRDALMTHRSAYVGSALNRDNLFYVPPELLLDERGGTTRGHWMCQQILRVLEAERARDDVFSALLESEREQRRLAEQLAEANRELEARVATRTRELEVANRHLEAFSYSVSHDLRAPLRAIAGFGTALAEEYGDRLDGEGRAHLDRVLQGTARMGELIDGMLELGKAVKGALARVPLDVTSLAERAASEVREGESGRSVEWVIHQGMRATGDPALVGAVFANLVGNAWKFTSRTERARIEIGQEVDEAGIHVFFVRDNGAGFDMRYAARLFGAFQRLHRQEEYAGTGVGLATVERIVSRHGGRVWADAEPGRGATFRFTLGAGAEGAGRPPIVPGGGGRAP